MKTTAKVITFARVIRNKTYVIEIDDLYVTFRQKYKRIKYSLPLESALYAAARGGKI